MSLYGTLAAALQRRVVTGAGGPSSDDHEVAPGVIVAYEASSPVPLAEASLFFAGAVDVRRLENLLTALLVLDWRDVRFSAPHAENIDSAPVPPAFAALVPFGRRRPVAVPGGTSVTLRLPEDVPALLAADRVDAVFAQVLQRLRVARVNPAPRRADIMAAGVSGAHLAAALLLPIADEAVAILLSQVAPQIPLERQERP
jgi:CRISPR-associated protein Csx17